MRRYLLIPLLLGCPALIQAQDAAPAPPDDAIPAVSLWDGIVMGGPIYVGLHLLMLVGFIVGLVLSVRRPCSVRAALSSIFPFIFGATAMWIGIIGISADAESVFFEDSIPGRLRLLHRPFLGGLGLSAIGVVVLLISRARKRRQSR